MEWWQTLALLFGILTLLLLLGLPAGFAFLAINLVGAVVYLGGEPGLMQVVRNGVASITNFSLTPIPFFVLMGEVLFHTGVAMKAIDAFDNVIWRVPGRLSVIAVVAGTVFSAISGSTIATTALLGTLLLPEMLKRGYHPSMAMGPIMAIGGVDMLIPPSALTVLLGSLAGISISGLLIAGVVPGVLLALMFVAYIVLRTSLNPALAPRFEHAPVSGWARWRPLVVYVAPLLLIFVVVIAAMSAGWATPTESAALGVLATVVVARRLSSRHAGQPAAGAAGHRGHHRHHPVHHHRRDDLLADPGLLRRHRRAGVAGPGRSAVALGGADRDDADPAPAGLLHRSGEHDAHHPALLHAAGAALRVRPPVVWRDVPHLHAARAAHAALRHAAVHHAQRGARSTSPRSRSSAR